MKIVLLVVTVIIIAEIKKNASVFLLRLLYNYVNLMSNTCRFCFRAKKMHPCY